jgi:hypothetical protein
LILPRLHPAAIRVPAPGSIASFINSLHLDIRTDRAEGDSETGSATPGPVPYPSGTSNRCVLRKRGRRLGSSPPPGSTAEPWLPNALWPGENSRDADAILRTRSSRWCPGVPGSRIRSIIGIEATERPGYREHGLRPARASMGQILPTLYLARRLPRCPAPYAPSGARSQHRGRCRVG